MNPTSSAATKRFVPGTSRRHGDTHTVRQQFEDWLAQVADDNDTARAERLTALFERSSFTRQKDLADELAVETRTVQRWLTGEGIAKRHWKPLAAALDTTVRFLMFGEEDEAAVDETRLDRIEDALAYLRDGIDNLTALVKNVDPANQAEDITSGFEADLGPAGEPDRVAPDTGKPSDATPEVPPARAPKKRRSA